MGLLEAGGGVWRLGGWRLGRGGWVGLEVAVFDEGAGVELAGAEALGPDWAMSPRALSQEKRRV
jgi:hypothetical protein